MPKTTQICVHCNSTFQTNLSQTRGFYCSKKCYNQHTKEQNKIEIFQKIEQGQWSDPRRIRQYLIEKNGHVCQQCRNSSWLDKPIPLDLEHIDGNSSNNQLSNLKMLCLNCHGLSPTYKKRNVGNGRAMRRQRYKQNQSY